VVAHAYGVAAAIWAASPITLATSPGWESSDIWLARSTVMLAFIRLACAYCSSGLTTRSSLVTMNQLGLVLHATAVTLCPKARPASRPCVAAKARASASAISGAIFFTMPSAV
jgi:hypothetical protein